MKSLPGIPQSFQSACPVVLDEHIGVLQKTIEYVSIGGRFQIERNTFLPTVERHEIGGLIIHPGTDLAGVIASSRYFDLYDTGAEIRENHRAVWSSEDSRKIDDDRTVQGTFDS
tara:strand:- start:175 stop:516 length:342 start_codon:yes stop_codon:yes gene_type:complete